MPELRQFPVFSERGRIGTLLAHARFLDDRTEKTIRLDGGGEVVVPAGALEVRPDGTFYLRERAETLPPEGAPAPKPEPKKDAQVKEAPPGVKDMQKTAPPAPQQQAPPPKEAGDLRLAI